MAAYTAINDPSAYFKIHLYSGTGSSNAQTFADTDTDMQPDMVWIKTRGVAESHVIFDSVRTNGYYLKPDANSAEIDGSSGGSGIWTSFDSDGFTVAGTSARTNTNTYTYVAWCWKESNATAGFDIVKFEGTGSAHTEAHSLSAVPHFIIFKGMEVTDNWDTFHTSLGPEVFPYINSTAVPADQTAFMNDTAPTSSVFTVGDATSINTDDKDTIAYCWTAKQGFSKFGTYEGNNDADGTFVYTGFRPRWVMLKNVDATEPWLILDTIRDSDGNPTNAQLEANDPGAESTNAARNTDFLSNGFKLRYANAALNSAETFIYAAFAEAPFVNSNGVPCTAR